MAQNGDSKSIVDWSREILKDLFKQKPLPGQWCTLTPKEMKSLDCAPSQSNVHYLQEEGCEDKVKGFLHDQFENIFTDAGHVESFWEDFSTNLSHKLGLTYRETQKMDDRKPYNEAKLKHGILHPIFTEVSKAACIIPSLKGGETVKTNYVIEDELEMEDRKSGQKPSVDAVIQVSKKEGTIKALIPVEMKVDMDTKNYSQIAGYMNRLSAVADVKDFTMVGVLIDKTKFRLAFSVFCNDSETVPLPIVYISPPIGWRQESLIHEPAMLVLTCTFLIGQLKRLRYDPSVHAPLHTRRASPATLNEMGEKLLVNPVALKDPGEEKLGLISLKRRIDEQNEEIKEGKKEIEGLKKKIKLLEESSKSKTLKKKT